MSFLKGLEKASINPDEIKLIILTHGHWDHIGSAAEIKKITGAKVVLHQNEIFYLNEYGISGKIVYTPGHSSGSVSVLMDSGEAFVGDMAMNKFPLRLSPGMPIYAENLDMLFDSWQTLLDAGAKKVFPAHGDSFSADIIRKELARMRA